MTRPVAAVYLRISLDKTGDGLAIERQRGDCLELIKARKWAVGEEYVDKVSAYRRDAKRDGYDALLADVRAGRVSRVVTWDLDRLTRQPRQLEEWIDLAEEHGIVVVTANGEADLSTDGGRMYARIKAAVAAAEIERKGARQRAAYRQKRATGLPPLGPRPFGFRKNRRTPLESEAKHIRRAYELFLSTTKGEGTVYAVRRYFAEQGVKTATGRDWSQATVRQLLARPSNAGLMLDNDRKIMVGKIKPIVSRETWDAAQAKLASPGRTVPAGRKPVAFWLAGVARCGACGGPMKAAGAKGVAYYRCKAATEPRADKTVRHVAMKKDDLEAIVWAEVMSAVLAGTFDGAEGSSERVDEIHSELASIRERAAEAQAAMLDGLGDPATWRLGLAKLSQRAEVLTEERDRLLARGDAVAPIAARWKLSAAWVEPFVDGWELVKGSSASYGPVLPEERRTLARGLGTVTVLPGRGEPLARVQIEPFTPKIS